MIYVASRVKHADIWVDWRNQGAPIASSWIDSANEGQSPENTDFAQLWGERIPDEVQNSRVLLLYATPECMPLKGAFIETGIAMGCRLPMVVCLPGMELEGETFRPIGSWIRHPLVRLVPDLEEAKALALSFCTAPAARP